MAYPDDDQNPVPLPVGADPTAAGYESPVDLGIQAPQVPVQDQPIDLPPDPGLVSQVGGAIATGVEAAQQGAVDLAATQDDGLPARTERPDQIDLAGEPTQPAITPGGAIEPTPAPEQPEQLFSDEERAQYRAAGETIAGAIGSLAATVIGPAMGQVIGNMFGGGVANFAQGHHLRERGAEIQYKKALADADTSERLAGQEAGERAKTARREAKAGAYFQAAQAKLARDMLEQDARIQQGQEAPQSVWENIGTFGTVVTFLGSAMFRALQVRQGKFGGPNPIAQQLNKLIDRDLQSQRSNLNRALRIRAQQGKNMDSLLMQQRHSNIQLKFGEAQRLGSVIATAKAEMAKTQDQTVKAAYLDFIGKRREDYGRKLMEVGALMGKQGVTFGQLYNQRQAAAAKARGGSGRKKKDEGSQFVEIEGGFLANPRVVLGNGQVFKFRNPKNIGDIKEVNTTLVGFAHSGRTLQSLLEIPDELLERVIAMKQRDPRFEQIHSRIKAHVLNAMDQVKGIPSDKDMKMVLDAAGGDSMSFIRFLRKDRAKRVWRDALGALQGQADEFVYSRYGALDEVRAAGGIRFELPKTSGAAALNLTDPDANPSPEDGRFSDEDSGVRGGGVHVEHGKLFDKDGVITMSSAREYLAETAKRDPSTLSVAERDAANTARAYVRKNEKSGVERSKAQRDWEKIDSATDPKNNAKHRRIKKMEKQLEGLKKTPGVTKDAIRVQEARIKALKKEVGR